MSCKVCSATRYHGVVSSGCQRELCLLNDTSLQINAKCAAFCICRDKASTSICNTLPSRCSCDVIAWQRCFMHPRTRCSTRKPAHVSNWPTRDILNELKEDSNNNDNGSSNNDDDGDDNRNFWLKGIQRSPCSARSASAQRPTS